MKYISIFDIVGPSMVGPSSSHTAGAIRIGLLARKIYGRKPNWVKFTLYNSFAKTGKGHGTDKGLVGGVLGFSVNDEKIKDSFKYAREQGIKIEFEMKEDFSRHPNAVDIKLYNESSMMISGSSLGAGEIQIDGINGFKVDLRGDFPTLLMIYKDQPGMLWKITKFIQDANINIATLHCERKDKGREASTVVCLDSLLPEEIVDKINTTPGIYTVRSIDMLEK
jgi:L-serine dehydratase